QARNRIVVRSAGDRCPAKFPRLRFRPLEVVDQDAAVNLRGLGFETGSQEQVRFFRPAFHEHWEGLADSRSQLATRNPALEPQELSLAALGDACGDLMGQLEAPARLLVGVKEYSEVIELGGAHEIKQSLEVVFRLAWEPHDHRGPKGHARDGGANRLEPAEKMLPARPTTHVFQDLGARVLKRDIEVFR